MKFRHSILLLPALAMFIAFVACGGGSKITTATIAQPISVTLAGAPASLPTNASARLTATITNDSLNYGVAWTASCSSPVIGACGIFSNNTATSATYTAPTAIPAVNTVTVTATSVHDPTKSASAIITLTAPVISVTLTGAPASLAANAAASLTATVANDSANAGVTWSVTCTSTGACGTFNPTSTASGTMTTYTAPSAIPTGNTVTVVATSVTDTTKSASAIITITAPGISVTLAGVPASLAANTTASLTATVANDSANAGVTWSVTCASAGACGTFNPASTASGTATTYTAPAAIPGGNTVTVVATSVTDTTKSASATITITAPGISVTLAGAPASLAANTTASLTATVANDSANAGVTWSVTCASAGACGTFNPASTASGTATTYTAPAAIPGGNTVTVVATSVTDTTKSASATITITPPGITVSLGPSPTSLQIASGGGISAFVANDPANAGVTWMVTCGSAGACGSVIAATTASGVATDFTAPAAIPTGNIVTVTATSVTDTTKSASVPITIHGANTTLADGTYVFSLAGQNGNDASGVYYVSGAFALSSGTITSGEQDYVDDAAGYLMDPITGGSVSVTADGNLQIVLNTNDSSVGSGGIETLDAVLASSTRARIIEFDSGITSSGRVDLQSSTAPPSAGYAFFTHGLDTSLAPVAIGGIINIDGSGTISGSGSVFDLNDGGSVSQAQTFSPSTVSTPDSFGRVVLSLVTTTPGIPTLNLAGYIVDTTHIRLVETTGDAFLGFMGGVALGQGTNTGTFSAASISGSSFVFGTTGTDTVSPAYQVAGVLTTNTDGSTLSGAINYNDLTGTGPTTPSSIIPGGTYTVDATGRVTLTGVTDGIVANPFNLQLYLTGTGQEAEETVVSMDPNDILAGLGFQQTGGGSFTASSLFGTYALDATGADATSVEELDEVGPVTADGVGTLTGTVDQNSLLFGPIAAASASGTFTASANGAFTDTITGLDVTNSASPDVFSYYVIDTTKVFMIETDTNQLTFGFFTLEQ